MLPEEIAKELVSGFVSPFGAMLPAQMMEVRIAVVLKEYGRLRAADEREACAQLAEGHWDHFPIAEAIRARGT